MSRLSRLLLIVLASALLLSGLVRQHAALRQYRSEPHSARNEGTTTSSTVVASNALALAVALDDPATTTLTTVSPSERPNASGTSPSSPANNTTAAAWQDGLYDGPLCPSLIRTAQHALSNYSSTYNPLHVTMMQLVGSWSDNSTGSIMKRIYAHNQRICARHSYQTMAITEVAADQHPAFAKILAVRDYCISPQAPELLWFLDGDVVLMNPYIKIEMIWYYYQSTYPDMDMLFACDNNDLNSGVFIVNCSSPKAMQLLDIWHQYAPVVNSWKNIHKAMYEQNGIHWLLQTHFWKRIHPRHKRFNELSLIENATKKDINQFAIHRLQQRVRVIENICELTVFPIDFICDAVSNKQYLDRGPRWWEMGHFAVHTAGTRNKFRRLPYLSSILDIAENMTLPDSPISSISDAAREYLDLYASVKSSDPTRNHSYEKCLREERRTNRLSRLELRAQEEAKAANTTNETSV